jgi:hypothetical protein
MNKLTGFGQFVLFSVILVIALVTILVTNY